MNALIFIHRAMFAGILIASFFLGVLNAGRDHIIYSMDKEYLINMSLLDLQSVSVVY